MGIAHAMILKWVGWSDKFLSDSSLSYIRPSLATLLQVPFKMIHQSQSSFVQQTNDFLNKGMVFDPWTQHKYRKRNAF